MQPVLFKRFGAAATPAIQISQGRTIFLPPAPSYAAEYKPIVQDHTFDDQSKTVRLLGFRLNVQITYRFAPVAMIGNGAQLVEIAGKVAEGLILEHAEMTFSKTGGPPWVAMVLKSENVWKWEDKKDNKPMGANLVLESKALIASPIGQELLWEVG